MLINSHSYCVCITFRDHSVTVLLVSLNCNFISSSEVKHKNKRSARKKYIFLYLMVWVYNFMNGTHICYGLTRVHDRLKGEVTPLNIKREFVHVQLAGAYDHLVISVFNQTTAFNGEIRTRRGFVSLCPVRQKITISYSHSKKQHQL